MEKKVPERKVKLKEDDIIYVYDKRINKCIREDCEGNVKYGLVLKVSVTEEENLNCFACNKCHMKYTPYPNYVRISKPELLHIYNQEEVTARDLKRAEDARKQALREKRKNSSKPYGKKSYDKKLYEKKLYEKKNFERKPYGRKPFEQDGNQKEERKPFEGRKSYEGNKPYENRKPYEGVPREGRRSYEGNKPYESRKNYQDRKPYEGRRSFDDKRNGERGSFEEKKPFEKKKGIFIATGNYNKKPYHKTNDKFERKD